MPSLPKKIHFVWVGPKQPMDDSKREVIRRWATSHPDYEINLWVDPISANKSMDELTDMYREIGPNIKIRDIAQMELANPEDATDDLLQMQAKALHIIRHEIDKPCPNYGCASDLARYVILYTEGGIYFDIDIDPPLAADAGPAVLDTIFSDEENLHQHLFGIDCCSQKLNPDLTDADLLIGQQLEHQFNHPEIAALNKADFMQMADRVSNDMLLCSAQNPLMLAVIHQVFANYDSQLGCISQHKGLSQLSAQTMFAYGGNNRMLYTLALTGPDVIRHILFSEQKSEKSALCSLRKLNADGEPQILVQPQPNALSWCRTQLRAFADEDTAITACVQAMEFEAEHFGILRLDDYSSYLTELFPENDSAELLSTFYAQVFTSEHISPQKLVLQNTYQFHQQRAQSAYLQVQDAAAGSSSQSSLFAPAKPQKKLSDAQLESMLMTLFRQADFDQNRFQITEPNPDDPNAAVVFDEYLLKDFLVSVTTIFHFVTHFPQANIISEKQINGVWHEHLNRLFDNLKRVTSSVKYADRTLSLLLDIVADNNAGPEHAALHAFYQKNAALCRQLPETIELVTQTFNASCSLGYSEYDGGPINLFDDAPADQATPPDKQSRSCTM